MTIEYITNRSTTTLGEKITEPLSITGNNGVAFDFVIPGAKVGELTTRTDNNTGVLTMAAGHGFTTDYPGDPTRLMVFWTNAGVTEWRWMFINEVDGNDVTVDGGEGYNLPTVNTAITAMVEVRKKLAVPANALQAFAYQANAQTFVTGFAIGATEMLFNALVDSNRIFEWQKGNGRTNPVSTSSFGTVLVSQPGTTIKLASFNALWE